MVLTLKHKIRHYRKFRTDIWGLSKLAIRKTAKKMLKRPFTFFSLWRKEMREKIRQRYERYTYQIKKIQRKGKPKRLKKRFASVRILKLFYLTLTYKQFYRMARLAKKKDGFFAGHFLLALEGRLISFLFRTGFVSNMFESLFYIKQRFVTLNKKVTTFTNHASFLFQVLSFHPLIKKKIYRNLIWRLLIDRRSLFNPPKYIYVSYWFLFAFMLKAPKSKKLVYPIRFFDHYRTTGFAFSQ